MSGVVVWCILTPHSRRGRNGCQDWGFQDVRVQLRETCCIILMSSWYYCTTGFAHTIKITLCIVTWWISNFTNEWGWRTKLGLSDWYNISRISMLLIMDQHTCVCVRFNNLCHPIELYLYEETWSVSGLRRCRTPVTADALLPLFAEAPLFRLVKSNTTTIWKQTLFQLWMIRYPCIQFKNIRDKPNHENYNSRKDITSLSDHFHLFNSPAILGCGICHYHQVGASWWL